FFVFFFQAEDGIRDFHVTGVQTCALPISFGTDAGVFPHGENADEFRLLVEAGMTPAQAILSATREAAKLLGQLHDFGTLEPGKRADIIAVRGNPLENVELLKNVGFVMKDGVVYKRDGTPLALR